MKKRERTQVPNNWDEEGLSVTEPSKIKRITRKYYEHLFFGQHVKKLRQNRQISQKIQLIKNEKRKKIWIALLHVLKIKFIIKNYLNEINLGPSGFNGEVYEKSHEEKSYLIQIFSENGSDHCTTYPKMLGLPLYQNIQKNSKKGKLQISTSHNYRYKNHEQNIC